MQLLIYICKLLSRLPLNTNTRRYICGISDLKIGIRQADILSYVVTGAPLVSVYRYISKMKAPKSTQIYHAKTKEPRGTGIE